MAFTIPDNDEAFNNNQSIWMQTDINALVAAVIGNGVVSGCLVTAQGTPDMTVAVASGTIQINDTGYSITGANKTITAADGSNPRIDLICANTASALTVTDGTAAANPKAPDIPANSVLLAMIYVPASDTDIDSNQITDKRVLIRQVTATTQKDVLTHTVLYSNTLGASGRWDVSSINQTYDHLLINLTLRVDTVTNADGGYIFFNNDTVVTNYMSGRHGQIGGASSIVENDTPTFCLVPGANSTANDFVNVQVSIRNYTSTSYRKTAVSIMGYRVDATNSFNGTYLTNWESTAAINRITIQPDGYATDEFIVGSSIEIIGVKEETVLIVT